MERPTILINFAISADGKVSTVAKDQARFTSKRDLQRLLEIRLRADALMVGHGTLRTDEMSLTVPAALKPSQQPLRCVVSRSGNFNPTLKIFQSDGGPIHLLVTAAADGYNGARYEALGATIHRGPLAAFLGALKTTHGVDTLLCEGGGTLVKALAHLDVIDEINLTFAGHTLLGGADAPTLTGLPGDFLPASRVYTLEEFEPLDNGECFLTYHRRRDEDRDPEGA